MSLTSYVRVTDEKEWRQYIHDEVNIFDKKIKGSVLGVTSLLEIVTSNVLELKPVINCTLEISDRKVQT